MYIALTTESWSPKTNGTSWILTDEAIHISWKFHNVSLHENDSKYTFNTTGYTYKRWLRYVLTYIYI